MSIPTDQKELRRLARALRRIREVAPMTVDEARDVIAASNILEGWDWAEMEDALEVAQVQATHYRWALEWIQQHGYDSTPAEIMTIVQSALEDAPQ